MAFNPKLRDPYPHTFVGSVRPDNSAADAIKTVTGLAKGGLDYQDKESQELLKKRLADVEVQEEVGIRAAQDAQADLMEADPEDIEKVNALGKRLKSIRSGEVAGKLQPGQADTIRKALIKGALAENPWLSPEIRQLARGYVGAARSAGGQDDVLQETRDKLEAQMHGWVESGAVKSYAEARQGVMAVQKASIAEVVSLPTLRIATEDYAATSSMEFLAKMRAAWSSGNMDLDQMQMEWQQVEYKIRRQAMMAAREAGLSAEDLDTRVINPIVDVYSSRVRSLLDKKTPQEQRDQFLAKNEFFSLRSLQQENKMEFNMRMIYGSNAGKLLYEDVYPVLREIQTDPTYRQKIMSMPRQHLPYAVSIALDALEDNPAAAVGGAVDGLEKGEEPQNEVDAQVRKKIFDQQLKTYRETGQLPRYINQSVVEAPEVILKSENTRALMENADKYSRLADNAITGLISTMKGERNEEVRSLEENLKFIESQVKLAQKSQGPQDDKYWMDQGLKIQNQIAELTPRVGFSMDNGFYYRGEENKEAPIGETLGAVHADRRMIALGKGKAARNPLEKLTQYYLLKKKGGVFKTEEEEFEWIEAVMKKLNPPVIEKPEQEEPQAAVEEEKPQEEQVALAPVGDGVYESNGKLVSVRNGQIESIT